MESDTTPGFEKCMRWQLEQILIAKRHVESDVTMSGDEKRRAVRDARQAFSRLGLSVEWACGQPNIAPATPKRQSAAQKCATTRRRIAHSINDARGSESSFDENQSLVVLLTREDGEDLIAAMQSANAGHAQPLLVPLVSGRKGDAALKDEARAKALELIEFRYCRYRDLTKERIVEEIANALELKFRTVMSIVYKSARMPKIESLADRLKRARAAGCLMRLSEKAGPLDDSDDACIARVYCTTGLPGGHEGDADGSDTATDDEVELRQSWQTGSEAAVNDLFRLACRLADPSYVLQMTDEHSRGTSARKKTLQQP